MTRPTRLARSSDDRGGGRPCAKLFPTEYLRAAGGSLIPWIDKRTAQWAEPQSGNGPNKILVKNPIPVDGIRAARRHALLPARRR